MDGQKSAGASDAPSRRTEDVVTVITSLADAYCYGAEPNISSDGQIIPVRARRKTFGRGLHRLRDRLRHLDERLQLDINGLKQEVLNLQLDKSLMERKLQAQWTRQADKAVECVMEYLRAFEHGWLEMPSAVHSQRLSPRGLERHRLLVDRQQHFVETAPDSAMRFGDFKDGLRVFVSQWRMYSQYIDSFHLSLSSLRCVSSTDAPVVVANAVVSGQLTSKSFRVLFPRVEPNERLAQRLIGAFIRLPCRLTCFFDRHSSRIIRYDCQVDAAIALLGVLGSLEDVEETLSGALCCDL